MNNEKMAILKMLEEGKISAEEAAKLLEALGQDESGGAKKASKTDFNNSTSSSKNAENKNAGNNYSDSDAKTGEGFEKFTEEMGRKLGVFMKDMEPKIQKFTEIVVEKTTIAADNISKSFATAKAEYAQSEKSARKYASPTNRSCIEKSFEMKVPNNGGELIIQGFKGDVLVKGYNSDKISAKIFYSTKRGSAKIDFTVLGNKYFLNYDENDYDKVSIDAFIPQAMFDNMKIGTTKGEIIISSITTKNIKIENANGDTSIDQLTAENIILESTSGQLKLNGIIAENASFESYNGGISSSGLDIAQLKMITFNGALTSQIAGFVKHKNYYWTIECSNDKLSLTLPSSQDVGYHLKAHAALSQVKIGLIGLNYIQKEKSYTEAESIDFGTKPKKVNINAETSNAPLHIN